MPARVNEQNIAILHICAFLDIVWRENANVIEHVTQVNDHTRSVTSFNGNLVNGFAFSYEMPRRIEMLAHMVRSLDVLRVDAMLRFAFDVLHLKWWIEGP